MPKRSIDELLEAIEAVDYLKRIVAEHDAAIALIIARLSRIEAGVAGPLAPP